jgi:D-alanyl-D-alanine carboxypeptidase
MLAALTAVIALMAGCSAGPQDAGPSESAGSLSATGMQQILTDVVRQSDGPPGAIAYVTSHVGVWQGAAGIADIATGEPMSAHLRYRIGSTTKTFTAVVVLQLVEEGLLGLDDPVGWHLPGVLPYPEPITIRQLLNHSAGIFDYAFAEGNPGPAADVPLIRDPVLRRRAERLLARARKGEPVLATPELSVAAATTHPLDFAPGHGFSYSNTGYQILTLLIERITGQPLAAVYRERIIGPLRLEDTYLPAGRKILEPHVHAYEVGRTGTLVDITADIGLGSWGEGGLVSTAADLATFFRALLGGRLIGPSLLAQMLQPTPGSSLGAFATGYGLGIERLRNPCGLDAWGHGGDIAGFKTSVIATRDGAYVAILVQNLANVGTENIRNRVSPGLLCTAWDASNTTGGDQGGS